MANKLRIMIDANILVAGVGWPRFSSEVLRHAVKGDCQLVLSPRIVEEARKAISEISPERLDSFDEVLETTEYEEVVSPTDEDIESNIDLVRDPKDVHVALAAIQAKVDYLVTQDKDLTALDDSTKKLRDALAIVLPGTFLRESMGWTSEALETIRNRKWGDLGNS
jgi:putative PIN family toxin of toxin-antitoxin system